MLQAAADRRSCGKSQYNTDMRFWSVGGGEGGAARVDAIQAVGPEQFVEVNLKTV